MAARIELDLVKILKDEAQHSSFFYETLQCISPTDKNLKTLLNEILKSNSLRESNQPQCSLDILNSAQKKGASNDWLENRARTDSLKQKA